MPLMFATYTAGAFDQDSLDAFADQITKDGEELEGLDMTDFVLSTTWVWCQEYPSTHVYHGGQNQGGKDFVTVQINVIQGGYTEATKKELIKRVTDAVDKYADLPSGEPRRVYVLLREVPENSWGFDGRPIRLEDLKNPPKDAAPL